MAKKQHISRVEPPTFDATKFAVTGNLPTPETVNQSVSEVTGVEAEKETKKKTPSVKEPIKTEKPKKSEIERGRDARGALNRVGITALVDKDLLKQTKILAIQKGLSMSDIINDALVVYLNSKFK